MTAFDLADVRRYYDRHTRRFIAYGQGGQLGAMHRAVWGPGVTTRAAAFRYLEDAAIAAADAEWPSRPALRAVDLGCGVGATLCYLAERLPLTGVGLTISETQAALAAERVQRLGLAARVRVLAGDYGAAPPGIGPADLVTAIESFVHAPDASRFFASAAALTRLGGLLMIADDFRRLPVGASDEADRAIGRFCRGWHVNTLVRRDEAQALAAAAGFELVRATDLTPYLELGRVRDRAIDLMASALARLPIRVGQLDPWVGGSALQRCLRRGWIGYDLVIFRRR